MLTERAHSVTSRTPHARALRLKKTEAEILRPTAYTIEIISLGTTRARSKYAEVAIGKEMSSHGSGGQKHGDCGWSR